MVKVSYKDVGRAIRQIKPPIKGLTIDVVLHPDYLSIRVYEDEIMEHNINNRMHIMEYLLLLRKTVQSFGMRCEIEGAASVKRKK